MTNLANQIYVFDDYKKDKSENNNNHSNNNSQNKVTYKFKRKRLRKKRRKHVVKPSSVLKVLAITCAVASIVLSGLMLKKIRRVQAISYESASYGSIYNDNYLDGIIYRDEAVFASPATGNFVSFIEEGQKIKKDAMIGAISPSKDEKNVDIDKELKQVDLDLLATLDPMPIRSEELFVDSDFDSIIDLYRSLDYNPFVDDLYDLRTALDRIIKIHNVSYSSGSVNNNLDYTSKAVQTIAEMGDNAIEVLAPTVGVLSYQIDGYENLEKRIKYSEFQELITDISEYSVSDIISSVTHQYPLLKIITDYTFSIVTFLPKSNAIDYVPGSEYNLNAYISNTDKFTLTAKLIDKDIQGDMARLIFELDNSLAKLLNHRKIQFTIGETETEGLKIPLSAIVEKSVIDIPTNYITTQVNKYGKKIYGVNKLVGNKVVFTEVSMYSRGPDITTIFLPDIENKQILRVSDVLVDQNTNIKIDKVYSIKGVFVINQGFAKFKPIVISTSNDEYAILSPVSELKLADQIISCAKGVEENDLVKDFDLQIH
ncbi:MAG: hypothetical protein ATN31_00680 [Candidatus Epulonipiscioides saccharophilum]|nr:MAG: hypothetical protein ATN31_00680 [Epulopiscium sp. AS2M-Bin001]